MSNITAFLDLMTRYNVPLSLGHQDWSGDYLNKPVDDQLFHGIDAHGRVFVNLPITHVASDTVAACSAHFVNKAFVVHQRLTDDEMIFVKAGPVLLLQNEFCGEHHDELTHLERLLAGNTLRFHTRNWTDEHGLVEDPNRWVEISLNA